MGDGMTEERGVVLALALPISPGRVGPGRALRPLSPTGRQVGIERLDRTKPPAEGLFGFVARGLALDGRLRRPAELGFRFPRPGDVLVPGRAPGLRAMLKERGRRASVRARGGASSNGE